MIYHAKLKLAGIVCGGCFNRINQTINQADLLRAIINHADQTVVITYDRERDYYQQVILKIQQIGYNAKLISVNED
jgi:copper chaperone CopZ